jgi:hypothetical protein
MSYAVLFLSSCWLNLGACGSVVVKEYATHRKVAGSITDEVIFLNLPNPSGPGVYLASNRNEYQKHKNNNDSGE